MRLLHTTTLKLHEFFDKKIPKYAILSHTWGAEEVTFQEMLDLFNEDSCQCGKAKRRTILHAKAGYQKILARCRQAKCDGLDYAWIDTCCIDKSSCAELSEAINSMWECHAPAPDAREALARCKWITRGWCLQELLAPSIVVFLAHDWTPSGLKCDVGDINTYSLTSHLELPDLMIQISKVTKIPEKALSSPYSLDRYSIAQKMSSAADRQTTRREDVAYCLLGLFEVNMPLLYGEGYRAFYRLQEELIRDKADHSIFAYTAGFGWTDALAGSPDKFRMCGNVWPSKKDLRPYRMTNRGVEIDLDVGIWFDEHYYVALLECFDKRRDQIAMLIIRRTTLETSRAGTSVCRAEARHTKPITLDRASKKKLGPIRRRKLLIARDHWEYENQEEGNGLRNGKALSLPPRRDI